MLWTQRRLEYRRESGHGCHFKNPVTLNSAAAAASVAWPHSGTSVVGVNQRRRNRLPLRKGSSPPAAGEADDPSSSRIWRMVRTRHQ